MEAQTQANSVLAEIREGSTLAHLRRRARCPDGSLDMRHRANKAFRKDSLVSDFYDPEDPAINVESAVIKLYLLDQQQRYDAARHQELTARVKKLELERFALLRSKEKAKKDISYYRQELKRLLDRLHRQPQE